eukprot:6697472-Prymnesium_polylepis.2
MFYIKEHGMAERTSPTKQTLTKTSSTPSVLITNIIPLKLELQILYRVVVTHTHALSHMVQTQDLLQTRAGGPWETSALPYVCHLGQAAALPASAWAAT